MKIREGYFPFKGFQTYFRVVGEQKEGTFPLVLLHGGPGSTHNYLKVLDELAEERMLIMYDQLGCGLSYVEGHEELWKAATWLEELEALLAHLGVEKVHLLGQSWGGMLAQLYCLKKQNKGIQSLILSSTLSSASLWAREQHARIALMSKEEREAIAQAEATGNFDEENYQKANEHFMKMYCDAPLNENSPECLRFEKRFGKTAYITAWGPNEYTPTGTLRDYEITDRLHEIHVPTLIISGTMDLSSPLIAKQMYDHIPNSHWELFENARHMCYAEDTPRYLRVLRKFLQEVEAQDC